MYICTRVSLQQDRKMIIAQMQQQSDEQYNPEDEEGWVSV